jgi:serine/threonine protein kinase
MDSYETIKQLAKGGQGITSLVKLKKNESFAPAGSKLVLKQTSCRHIKAGNEALKEAKFLQRVRHNSVVQYHDVFLHSIDGFLVICTVMELCNRGDLAHYLQDKRKRSSPLTEQACLLIFVASMRPIKSIILIETRLCTGHTELAWADD